MRLVIVESPYRGNLITRWLNLRYARACVRDCLMRGESPYASHLLYTQRGILRDHVPEERTLGMRAGFGWATKADAIVVYVDRGITPGMQLGITTHRSRDTTIEHRSLYGITAKSTTPC